MNSLHNQIILITGGGSGLGAATCAVLAEAGATVIAADVNVDAAKQVAQKLCDEGHSARALKLDVTDPASVQSTVDDIGRAHGRLDGLINSAGTDKTIAIDELDLADWARVMEVNLTGPFLCSQAALKMMKQQGSGHIVNIISTAAKRAWPNASAYHASKWGVLGFSHALHVEARPHGVKTTAVVAGGMRTPFLLDRFPDIDESLLQDPRNVADTIRYVLTQPKETVIPEVMVLPMRETSWP